MNAKNFRYTLQNDTPPAGISLCLQALWHDGKKDWEEAHRLIQDEQGSMPARIHAYLHRKEGDIGNARYWYRLSGVDPFSGNLQEEWDALVQACLDTQ